jgi:shikimate kinase
MVDRVVLVGMMGAGKTTVGRRLADRLGWDYLDSDEQVAAATGQTVPEIFAHEGEAAFRAVEARVLATALTGERPVVVSAAGGVVLSEANRALLTSSGTVVWLRADPALLARRVGAGEGRPLLDEDPPAVLARLAAERRDLYAAVAAVTVDVDDLSPAEVVKRILADRVLVDAGIGPRSGG